MKTIKTLLLACFFILPQLSSAEIVSSGKWTKKAHSADGTWSIDKTDGKTTLTIKDLKTKNAPDLKIYLSPKSSAEVSGKTATSGSAFIAKLKSNKGTHTYSIPATVNLSKYKSIIIHCKKFTKLWTASSL